MLLMLLEMFQQDEQLMLLMLQPLMLRADVLQDA